MTKMRELICSLSNESVSDEESRLKVTKILKTKLWDKSNDNTNCAQFANLFDETLTNVGGELQSTAKKNAIDFHEEQ